MLDSKSGEKYYSVGEFARLSGTTRDTLLHYDNIGILKPAYVGENGYRYYLMEQVYQIKWIQYIQRLDVKLCDIPKSMGTRQKDAFISLLQDRMENFENELKRTKMIIRVLQNTIRNLTSEKSVDYNLPYFQYMEEEYLFTSELKLELFQDPLQLDSLYELMNYLRENYLWDEIYIGSIVLKENLEKGDISTRYWYTRVSMPLHDEHMMVKPAGTYAVVNYYGSPYKLVDVHEKLLHFINEKGYKVAGHAYEADFAGFCPFDDKNECATKIMIQVDRK